MQRREPGTRTGVSLDGELLLEGKLDEGLLTLAAEADSQRVEQDERERGHDRHGGGEAASSRGQTRRCRGPRDLRYAGGSESAARGRRPSCENAQDERAAGVDREQESNLIRMTFVRVARGQVPRLRFWLDSLGSRRDELAESYRRQHTRRELFYLVEGRDDPILVIATESADLRAGAKEFLNSELAIDVEFKTLIQEVGVADLPIEQLFDSRDLLPLRGRSSSNES